MNGDLSTWRRVFDLAAESGTVSTLLTRVRLMRGENHRELVGVTLKEERNRLETVSLLGPGQTEACAPAPKPAEAKKEDHKQ